MQSGIQSVFAKNVRRLRRGHKLTQQQLADLVEVSPSFIGLIETGKSNVSFATIEMLAMALKVSASSLFMEDEQRTSVPAKFLAEPTPLYSTVAVRLFSEVQHVLGKYKEEIYNKDTTGTMIID